MIQKFKDLLDSRPESERKEISAKVMGVSSADELKSVVSGYQVDITDEEASALYDSLFGETELSDEELDAVSGGCGDSKPAPRNDNDPNQPRIDVFRNDDQLLKRKLQEMRNK